MEYLLIPSLICMLIPTFVASFMKPFKGTFELPEEDGEVNSKASLMLYLGLGMIVFVPIFKTIFHLPPYIGMMLSLVVVALFEETFSFRKFRLSYVGVVKKVKKQDYLQEDIKKEKEILPLRP